MFCYASIVNAAKCYGDIIHLSCPTYTYPGPSHVLSTVGLSNDQLAEGMAHCNECCKLVRCIIKHRFVLRLAGSVGITEEVSSFFCSVFSFSMLDCVIVPLPPCVHLTHYHFTTTWPGPSNWSCRCEVLELLRLGPQEANRDAWKGQFCIYYVLCDVIQCLYLLSIHCIFFHTTINSI